MLNIIPVTMLVATMGADPDPMPVPPAEPISQHEPASTTPDEG